MKRVTMALLLCAATFCLAAPARGADKVKQLIERAARAYEKGDNQQAVDLLQQAATEIQKKIGRTLEAFLPEPPRGWTADEVERESFSGTNLKDAGSITKVSRRYRRKDDEVEITITNMPQLVKGVEQMLKQLNNPAVVKMMNQQPGTRVEIRRKHDWTILAKQQDDDSEVTAVRGDTMIQVRAPGQKLNVAAEFYDLVDTKALGKVPGK
ncbi:MAG: hypothetical protein ACOCXX_00305 [Planctomycetota bacterium]